MSTHTPPPQPKTPVTICSYDPYKTRRPNPLGMRAFVSLVGTADETYVIYEHLPERLGFSDARATVELRKQLTFFKMNLSEVRQLLKRDARYIAELTGDDDRSLYPSIDSTLTCRPSTSSGPSFDTRLRRGSG